MHDFLDVIQQLLTRNGVRRTWKEQGRSTIATKQGRTKTSQQRAGNKQGRTGRKLARLGKDHGRTMRRTVKDQVRRREKHRGQAEQ